MAKQFSSFCVYRLREALKMIGTEEKQNFHPLIVGWK
jgi:hypothetical protein